MYEDEKYVDHGEISRSVGKVVYNAVESTTNRDVIIKDYFLPSLRKRTTLNGQNRFCKLILYYQYYFDNLQVIKDLGDVPGSSLVRILDFSIQDQTVVVVCEKSLGGPPIIYEGLGKWKRSLDIKTSAIAQNLLHALSQLHNAGFAHNDIKPQNIVSDTNGKTFLIDLDHISKVNDPCPRVGTDCYKSLKKLEDAPGYTARQSDLYAVGVTLFCVEFLRLPYSITGDSELIAVELRDFENSFVPESAVQQLMRDLILETATSTLLVSFGYEYACD